VGEYILKVDVVLEEFIFFWKAGGKSRKIKKP